MIKIHLLAGLVGAALALSPLGAQQRQSGQSEVSATQNDTDGVQAAIAFERAKDRADARQAKLEARHPSVDYSSSDHSMNSSDGHHVLDPGPAQWKRDKTR